MSSDGVKSVFVSGPLTDGDTLSDGRRRGSNKVYYNMMDALYVTIKLMDMGLMAYTPHLSYYLQRSWPRDYKDWIRVSLYWLDKCDALYRIGPSKGADIELEYALNHEITILHNMDEVIEWMRIET